jgi:hypothetical protein
MHLRLTSQGILGLAFQTLARPLANPIVPFFDTLVANGVVDTFALQLCDAKVAVVGGQYALSATPSFIELGSTEASLADVALTPFYYSPLSQQEYYSVTLVKIALGTQPLSASCWQYNSPFPAIVDRYTSALFHACIRRFGSCMASYMNANEARC